MNPLPSHLRLDPARINLEPPDADILRVRCSMVPASVTDENLLILCRRMESIMRERNGVGLAAPQVGIPWQVFVAEMSDGRVGYFVNPRLIVRTQDYTVEMEECLSLPGIRCAVQRPTEAIVYTMRRHVSTSPWATATGRVARIWQHEMDHLDGVLITDRVKETILG